MKRILNITAVVTAVVLCFGIAVMVSPVQAAPITCRVEACSPDQVYHTVCCPEWVPDNPRCRSKKNCPGEWVLICVEEPCDEYLLDTDPVSPVSEETSVACP